MLIALILNYYKFYNIITYDKPTTLHLVVDKYISSFGGGCQQMATYIFIYITLYNHKVTLLLLHKDTFAYFWRFWPLKKIFKI